MLRFIATEPSARPAFERIEGAEDARVLIVCDHASHVIPEPYGDLGVHSQSRLDHIAWDIGAGAVSRALARRLDCPAVLAGVSRLMIDCNRQPGDPTSIPAVSGGIRVPGNEDVNDSEADFRAEKWFWPYHHEIGVTLSHLWRHGLAPAMVSVHSFTPVWHGVARPWHVGVLWNRDPRMAVPVIRRLQSHTGLVVGDNEPYSGREINYTLDTHAGAAGLPHVSFEIRQDQLADEAGVEHWADLLADALAPVLAETTIHRAEVF